MCSYVSCEVLRQCIAANPADIYMPSVCSLWRSFPYHSVMAVLSLIKKNPFYMSCL